MLHHPLRAVHAGRQRRLDRQPDRAGALQAVVRCWDLGLAFVRLLPRVSPAQGSGLRRGILLRTACLTSNRQDGSMDDNRAGAAGNDLQVLAPAVRPTLRRITPMKPKFRSMLIAFALTLSSPAFAGQQIVKLSVPGMYCDACPAIVKGSLQKA